MCEYPREGSLVISRVKCVSAVIMCSYHCTVSGILHSNYSVLYNLQPVTNHIDFHSLKTQEDAHAHALLLQRCFRRWQVGRATFPTFTIQ